MIHSLSCKKWLEHMMYRIVSYCTFFYCFLFRLFVESCKFLWLLKWTILSSAPCIMHLRLQFRILSKSGKMIYFRWLQSLYHQAAIGFFLHKILMLSDLCVPFYEFKSHNIKIHLSFILRSSSAHWAWIDLNQ